MEEDLAAAAFKVILLLSLRAPCIHNITAEAASCRQCVSRLHMLVGIDFKNVRHSIIPMMISRSFK
jgi:hypothetical protein